MAKEPDPKKGDESDHRCGLVNCRRGDHKLGEGNLDWCSGCDFYICEGCGINLDMPCGEHDVMEHLGDDMAVDEEGDEDLLEDEEP